MRDDLAKQLCERLRSQGVKYKYTRRIEKQNLGPEDVALPEGMGRPHVLQGDTKSLSEFFSPLKGILRKNVGRPWAKVFSELNASLHGGGVVIDHARLHLLRDFVHINDIAFHEGVPYYKSRSGFKGGRLYLRLGEFFVDPHGSLRIVTKGLDVRAQRLEPRYKPDLRKMVSMMEDYYRKNGVWYHVWYAPLPLPLPDRPNIVDFFAGPMLISAADRLKQLYGVVPFGRNKGMIRYVKRAEVVGKREAKEEGLVA